MRKPTPLIGIGPGREVWLSIDLDSNRFTLESERRTLSMGELKKLCPTATDPMAGVPSFALRTSCSG